ncbi:hypothetical protein OESDEN_06452, partial [Oesophagostomum dentatum]
LESAKIAVQDEETKESEEEKVLKKAIDRCVTALFTNTADSITSKLAEKVLDFVRTIQFETQLATDMISSLIAQMTYNGAIGLWYMLYMLSRVYPENSRYISERLNRPLSEWVPVREWGKLHDLRESKMAWYVPGEKAKQMVKDILMKFLFPVVDSLRNATMDRDTLKKAFTILSYGLSGSITCFPMPSSPPFISPNTVLPWFKKDLLNPALVHWEIAHPSGRNFREELVDVLELVIERLMTSKREHSQVLSSICRILHNVIHTSHSDAVSCLVRSEARAVLATLFSEFAVAKETIVEDILPTLSDPDSTRDHLKGALCMISQAGWATSSTIATKIKVWKAIIEMKVVDYPEVIDLYDELWNDIGKMQKPLRKHYECKTLNAFCSSWLEKLPKNDDWSKFRKAKALEATRQMRAARKAVNQKEQQLLVETLLVLYGKKDLLHTRQKLCRAMLWRCQKEKCGLKTIKVI